MTAFRVLVADPPWQAKDKLPGKRGAAHKYQVLPIDEICQFPIPRMAADSILFLWRVAWMPEEALCVCRSWGFTPKSEIVWKKLTKHGKRHCGLGRYVRMEHETCVIATRGRFKVNVRNVRSVFEAPTPTAPRGHAIHSAKPDAFYALVERLCDGPYAELFARRARDGWAQWGDQLAGGSASPTEALHG